MGVVCLSAVPVKRYRMHDELSYFFGHEGNRGTTKERNARGLHNEPHLSVCRPPVSATTPRKESGTVHPDLTAPHSSTVNTVYICIFISTFKWWRYGKLHYNSKKSRRFGST